MEESKKRLSSLEHRLQGKVVSVYETDFNYRPIRQDSKLICKGRILRVLGEPRSHHKDSHRPLSTLFCRIAVTWAPARHRGKIGSEFLFNVANEDIEMILADEHKTSTTRTLTS